jgi:DNA-binding MarR family transcriptional regulator
MKQLRFSGRETAVLRAIDFANGTTGEEILAKTRMDAEEAMDILNGLMDAGYVETNPPQQAHVTLDQFNSMLYEINPAFAHDLKKAMIRT